MRGAPFGLRPCRVRPPLEMRVVGNDPCVVPHRLQDTVQRRGYILPLYYTPNLPVCQEGEIAGERRTRGFVPRFIRDSLKSPEIQNFPHKDLPCNAGRSLWGKFLGSRGASSKEAPEWGAGQSPATFLLHQLVLQRSLCRTILR